MSIKYRDINSAYKASELHGHVLTENTMIGVKLLKPVEKKSNGYLNYADDYSCNYLKKKTKKRQTTWKKITTYVFNFDD